MCDSRRPENGADSDWTRYPFRVLVEDEDGGRMAVTVRAMGPNDARNLAFEAARDKDFDPVAVLSMVPA